MSTYKYQGLVKKIGIFCTGLCLNSTSLIAMEDLEFENNFKRLKYDPVFSARPKGQKFLKSLNYSEEEKITNERKMYERAAQQNYNAIQKLSEKIQIEAKKGSFYTFDQEENKRRILAIEVDFQEKEKEAAENAAYNEKADNLEYEYRKNARR